MSKQFYSLRDAVDYTGLSYKMLRIGCLSGKYPHIRAGEGKNAKIYVNMPMLLRILNKESVEGK